MSDRGSIYRGRFAPSPTGPLHMGSLVAALASYLDARHVNGAWLLRIEDIDPPREDPLAAAAITRGLRAHGLNWDGDVLFQSTRTGAYSDALNALAATGLLFPCACTRQTLRADGSCGGRCNTSRQKDAPQALRLRVDSRLCRPFTDLFQGSQAALLDDLPADFVVRRKDGLFAYNLAVTVDDHHQRVSDVIRGADLLPLTPLHLYLQQLLGYPQPRYGHCPLLVDASGQKLSKQNHAPAVDDSTPTSNLRRALALLGQDTLPAQPEDPAELLELARLRWRREPLRDVRTVQ